MMRACYLASVNAWVAGRLLLLDLSYLKWQIFTLVHDHRGFFGSRLRADGDLVSVPEDRRWRGASRRLVGRCPRGFSVQNAVRHSVARCR